MTFRKITSQSAARIADIPPATIAATAFLLATGALLGLTVGSGLSAPFDKALHGVYFALLTVSLSGFFKGRAAPALVVALLIAAGGELAQSLIPYREMSLLDFGAGAIGALSAAGVLSIKINVAFPAEELGFIERERALRADRTMA